PRHTDHRGDNRSTLPTSLYAQPTAPTIARRLTPMTSHNATERSNPSGRAATPRPNSNPALARQSRNTAHGFLTGSIPVIPKTAPPAARDADASPFSASNAEETPLPQTTPLQRPGRRPRRRPLSPTEPTCP